MHPWRGRSRPPQPELPLRDPDAVLGDRHPQVIACENFFGAPVRRFDGVKAKAEAPRGWGAAWLENLPLAGLSHGEVEAQGGGYVDNGLVWHLEIERGEIRGVVLGSQLYAQQLRIRPLELVEEAQLVEACRDRVPSTRHLLQGHVPSDLLARLAKPGALIPGAEVVEARCSCGAPGPCKHVLAILLAVAHRLETRPEELFRLRGTNVEVLKGLLPTGFSQPAPARRVPEAQFDSVFDLRLERPEARPEAAKARNSDPLGAFEQPPPSSGEAETEAPAPKPAPEPEPEPDPALDASGGGWLDEEDDDEDETVFGGHPTEAAPEELLEVTRTDLLDLGLPSHRIQRWLSDGTLVRTPKRGQYQLTAEAWQIIEPMLPTD